MSMKRKILGLLIGAALLITTVPVAQAIQQNFVVSAVVPAATGASLAAASVVSTTAGPVFTPIALGSLNFGTLKFDTANGIYLPDHFFAIDVGTTGGAGTPSVNVQYTDGTSPTGATKTLGDHTQATFVRVPGTGSEVTLTSHTKVLKSINETVLPAEIAGGFLRIYVGVVTGENGKTAAGGVPFSNADAPGTYTGALVVTATVV
jgi:hypothetical protein